MRASLLKFCCIFILGFFSQASVAQSTTESLAKEDIVKIALHEAGCKNSADCDVQARFEVDKWICLVSFVSGRNKKGEPQFKPGAWVGLTFSSQGKLLGRVSGK